MCTLEYLKGLVKGTFEKMLFQLKTCAKAVTNVEACQPIRNAFLIFENKANFSLLWRNVRSDEQMDILKGEYIY